MNPSDPRMTQIRADSGWHRRQPSERSVSPQDSSLFSSFSSVQTMPRAREIDVHIDELVLHGLGTTRQRDVVEGLLSELGALLAKQGVPTAWQNNPGKLEAEPTLSRLTNPTTAGAQIANAIYHSDQPKGGNSHHSKRGIERI